jgi:hypothetical protein
MTDLKTTYWPLLRQKFAYAWPGVEEYIDDVTDFRAHRLWQRFPHPERVLRRMAYSEWWPSKADQEILNRFQPRLVRALGDESPRGYWAIDTRVGRWRIMIDLPVPTQRTWKSMRTFWCNGGFLIRFYNQQPLRDSIAVARAKTDRCSADWTELCMELFGEDVPPVEAQLAA